MEGAMADPRSRCKLAAIMKDVVGYSRLMAANEAATVETLKSYSKQTLMSAVCTSA
jgi:hypothetical protein